MGGEMKKRIGGMLSGILLGALAAGAAHAQSPSGPLGYWKGDDGAAPTNAADASGNLRTGTYLNGATTSATVPALLFTNPTSMSFDGTNDSVSVPDDPGLRITGDITIAFWKRKAADAADWTRLVGKGNATQRNYGVWEFPATNGRIKFQEYDAAGASILEVDSALATAVGTWYHIACTISGSAATLYIDGTSNATGTRTGTPGTAADPLTFGYAGFHTYFNGQLDDIRIYNRALTAGEVGWLAAGNGPPAAPTSLGASNVTVQVDLTWTATATAPPPGSTNTYQVKRSLVSGGPYTVIASGIAGTTYSDTSVTWSNTYYYVVTAVNTGGASANSNQFAAAVLPPPPKTSTSGSNNNLFHRCGCNTVAEAPGALALWGAGLLALGLIFLRRR